MVDQFRCAQIFALLEGWPPHFDDLVGRQATNTKNDDITEYFLKRHIYPLCASAFSIFLSVLY